MTALERAKQIAHGIGREFDKRLCATIERAINEHCNAEVERRRAVEAKLAQAREALTTILTATSPCGTEYGDSYVAGLAKEALEALEND